MEKRKESSSYRKGISAFIACSKQKKHYPCTANLMYGGSLFKKSLQYCRLHYEHIYILSAKYGVLELNQVIEPYDLTLKNMSKLERAAWYRKVSNQMLEMKIPQPFVFYTGHLYNDPFAGIKPLNGLGLGQQLQYFTERLKGDKLL